MFYASGARHYYDISPELLWSEQLPTSLEGYLRTFDALAEHPAESNTTANDRNESMISWYADGTLSLRGFYFSSQDATLNYLLLHPERARRIEGYGYGWFESGRVSRFQESREGDYLFVALACDVGDVSNASYMLFPKSFWLPKKGARTPQREIRTFIARNEDYLPHRDWLLERCGLREGVPMISETIAEDSLLSGLEGEPPIRFYPTLQEALEGRYGAAETVEVGGDGWPTNFRIPDGPHTRYRAPEYAGKTYSLADSRNHLVRTDMENLNEWTWNRYGGRGRFETESSCLATGDSCAHYQGTHRDDHLAGKFIDVWADGKGLLFFSAWVKPLNGGELPTLLLQDGQFNTLGEATPALKRGDGWILMAGWVERGAAARLRLAILPRPEVEYLIDKALLVETSEPSTR